MADYRVTCITKPHPHSSHEHISHIGGSDATGKAWKITREDAIKFIDEKVHTFHVWDTRINKRAEVGVVRPTDGRAPYLRTYADGVWSDNLLALMQCA